MKDAGGNKIELKDITFHQDPDERARGRGTDSLVSLVVAIDGEPPTPEQQESLIAALNNDVTCKAAIAAAFAKAGQGPPK